MQKKRSAFSNPKSKEFKCTARKTHNKSYNLQDDRRKNNSKKVDTVLVLRTILYHSVAV